jgi:hypothetical protein
MTTKTVNKVFLSHYNTINIPNNYTLEVISDPKAFKLDNIDELFLKDIIGICEDTEIASFLKAAIDSLSPKGILHIQDIDIEQFCLYMSQKILPITDKNLLYYNRNNMFYMRHLVKILQGFKNISISQLNFINGYEFYIMVEKNG